MQKSLVFKEKFKHIHHPGQTKYSMSVGIGCLSHLFAVSVPGQGSAVKTRFFFFPVSRQIQFKMGGSAKGLPAWDGSLKLGMAIPVGRGEGWQSGMRRLPSQVETKTKGQAR